MVYSANLHDLSQQFGIPGRAQVVAGNNGLPWFKIRPSEPPREMYLHGAHVTSWRPTHSQEVIFLSKTSVGRMVARSEAACRLVFLGSAIKKTILRPRLTDLHGVEPGPYRRLKSEPAILKWACFSKVMRKPRGSGPSTSNSPIWRCLEQICGWSFW